MAPAATRAALALLALLAAPPALAASVTLSRCTWRNDLVCDASPGFVIRSLSNFSGDPSEDPLMVSVLQVAAMEAACNVYDTDADCVAADACVWNAAKSPACAVDSTLLSQRDVFRSGCPGSLMESYVRCGAAISKAACSDAGPNCAWFDELEERAEKDGGAARRPAAAARSPVAAAGGVSQRRLQQKLLGAVPSTVPRACMPRQLYALEKRGDSAGVQRVLKQIANQDPAVWGDCAGADALRAMTKICLSFSSPGTCKSIGPLCRWNELARACLTTGAGQAAYVLGANSTDVSEQAQRCAQATGLAACSSMGSVTVDPKLFVTVQRGDFGSATNGARRAGAAAAAVAVAAGAAAALAVLL
ncbi:hypothetical protein Rsub_13027 [Raphidocelis subcapitata]|uniref:Uncharacterized protein n=1 Tax=Raphidocelis subcapitata TaxID=307507 RepID=A0A2V0PKJ7_9CHLO|nr:hypothetical protein Rsub_13027 [Raphidocelis subcapitata]|eukprot:GBG00319.1 hypothetical protein Rsub_13027 [Raphidocelis subcapitata]